MGRIVAVEVLWPCWMFESQGRQESLLFARLKVDGGALNVILRWFENFAVSCWMAGARDLFHPILGPVSHLYQLLIWQYAPSWRSCES